ncbi:MAG: hypothetical protein R3C32_10650 [Chloroflexota bacterium]
MAAGVRHDGGCYLVPAFTGLGAPWWDPRHAACSSASPAARGCPTSRATVDSIAYQVQDVG